MTDRLARFHVNRRGAWLIPALLGALAAAAVLWREPLGRFKARFVKDATVFTGLDAMTMPLLRKLTETGRRAGIVVIEPDAGHSLLDEARGLGAHVMVGDPPRRGFCCRSSPGGGAVP
jgi:hypothetical protein